MAPSWTGPLVLQEDGKPATDSSEKRRNIVSVKKKV